MRKNKAKTNIRYLCLAIFYNAYTIFSPRDNVSQFYYKDSADTIVQRTESGSQRILPAAILQKLNFNVPHININSFMFLPKSLVTG